MNERARFGYGSASRAGSPRPDGRGEAGYPRRRARGFTLLEVLVSVAILGLGLTAILSAQFSAVAGASHARHMSVAVGLARCKMSELEDKLRVDGFQELAVEDSGPCCEGDQTPRMGCSWIIEKPVFPEPDLGKLELDTDLDTSALGKLAEQAQSGGLPNTGQGLDGISKALGGEVGALAAGGVGGIASMLMGDVYPQLKPILEASTRRVTVVLSWTEGDRPYDITVVQWITKPQPGQAIDLAELVPAPSTSGSAGPPPPRSNAGDQARGPR